jgi:hypothetical protein
LKIRKKEKSEDKITTMSFSHILHYSIMNHYYYVTLHANEKNTKLEYLFTFIENQKKRKLKKIPTMAAIFKINRK